ncbi:MAG TPA: GNAT family N-acetyltransferase [Ktedonobacteraceae bacterium]|nr:GNAT family N-acetyltransferase [Ktedonobacteraceae bacterium]
MNNLDNPLEGIVKKQQLTEAEMAEVTALVALCKIHDGVDLTLLLEMMKDRTDNDTNDFLFYEDGKLLGALALDSFGTEDKEMTGLVHPDYRRRGIFTALVNEVKVDAQARGIHQLIFVCDRFSRSGQAFIEAIGAHYDFSEHRMVLSDFKERDPDSYEEHIALRPATLANAGVLAYVLATSFGESEHRTKEHLEKDILNPRRRYYLVMLGDDPVGCFNLWVGDTIGIYAFCVLPQFRKRGFGRQMLEQIIRQVRAESQQSITLEVDTTNNNAYPLYRSCGFRETTTVGYYTLDLT